MRVGMRDENVKTIRRHPAEGMALPARMPGHVWPLSSRRLRTPIIVLLVLCLLAVLGAAIRQFGGVRAHLVTLVRLAELASLEPIDTHTHVFQTGPAFVGMLKRLHMHVPDIRESHV